MKGKLKIHSLPSRFVVKMRIRHKHRYARKRSKTQGNYAQRLKCAWSCMAAQTNLNSAFGSLRRPHILGNSWERTRKARWMFSTLVENIRLCIDSDNTRIARWRPRRRPGAVWDVSGLQGKSSNAHREPLWSDILKKIFINTAEGVWSMACPLAKLETCCDSFESVPQNIFSLLKIEFFIQYTLLMASPPPCLPVLLHILYRLEPHPFLSLLRKQIKYPKNNNKKIW